MRKKRILSIAIAIIFIVICGFFLLRINAVYGSNSPVMYESHTAVVEATIANLLQHYTYKLPKQSVDLSRISHDGHDGIQDIILTEVVDWQVENVVLQNTVPIASAIFDDDPIYGLEADLLITYEDGTHAVLTWESWRYGIVLGSSVLSLGNGPPGYITAVIIQ